MTRWLQHNNNVNSYTCLLSFSVYLWFVIYICNPCVWMSTSIVGYDPWHVIQEKSPSTIEVSIMHSRNYVLGWIGMHDIPNHHQNQFKLPAYTVYAYHKNCLPSTSELVLHNNNHTAILYMHIFLDAREEALTLLKIMEWEVDS